jgi:endonuclease YncB( thermonuclease family)
MQPKWSTVILTLVAVGLGGGPAFAGDSFYGTVTEVKSAEVVTLDSGAGAAEVRLVGIDTPAEGPIASQAKQLVTDLVLGKHARMRLDHLADSGVMVGRLTTDDPALGIRDVAVELVRAGLAQREQGFDYKYGELAAAEREARAAKRGLWASAPIP